MINGYKIIPVLDFDYEAGDDHPTASAFAGIYNRILKATKPTLLSGISINGVKVLGPTFVTFVLSGGVEDNPLTGFVTYADGETVVSVIVKISADDTMDLLTVGE